MSIIFKLLTFFYPEEKIFSMKFQEILFESESMIFQDKYPLDNLERFQGISFILLKIHHLENDYCLYKEKTDLVFYKNCDQKTFPFLKIHNFYLKKISFNEETLFLEGFKKLKFFLNSQKYKITSLNYKKEKKTFQLSSFNSQQEKCLILDENCSVLKNSCFECPFGFFEIYTPHCESQRERICGKTLCGTYNNYACLRGYHHPLKTSGCQEGSEEVFCQKDLLPHCVNNTLICL